MVRGLRPPMGKKRRRAGRRVDVLLCFALLCFCFIARVLEQWTIIRYSCTAAAGTALKPEKGGSAAVVVRAWREKEHGRFRRFETQLGGAG